MRALLVGSEAHQSAQIWCAELVRLNREVPPRELDTGVVDTHAVPQPAVEP